MVFEHYAGQAPGDESGDWCRRMTLGEKGDGFLNRDVGGWKDAAGAGEMCWSHWWTLIWF